MKLNRISTDLAREEDADKILEINRLEYGVHDILATRADFVWRYDGNPAGQAIVPVIRDEYNDVIGCIWVVPLRVRFKGRDYPAATGTNLIIHPEYRNSLGYTKLMRRFQQVFKDDDIALHFSFVSEKAYRRRRDQEPHTVSVIPLLVRPLRFKSLTQTYSIKGWQGFIVNRVGPLVSPFLFRQQPVATGGEIAVQTVKLFTQDFDNFWDKNRDKYPVMTVRDRPFLSWRFASVSGRQYHILVARSQDRMLGYAVLRNCMIRGVKTGLIMDLLVDDGPLGEMAGAHLLSEAEIYFRDHEVSLAAGLVSGFTPEYRVLRQAGYIGLPQALGPRAFRFAFFVHDLSERELSSLCAQDWFITLADYESF